MGGPTHQVTNQPPALTGYDVFSSDSALVEAVERHGGSSRVPALAELGRLAGSAGAQRWGFDADTSSPVLRTHDRFGNRIDEVGFHPSWHELMRTAIAHRMGGGAWSDPGEVPHVARAAAFLTWTQVDSGHGCPMSMSYAAVPALRADPAQAAVWEPLLTSTVYDPVPAPAARKAGAVAGMAMTEKQGGTDVRANTTRAEPVPGEPGVYTLTGHKWFCSAPMSDVFLVLAQAPGGLTCFVLPRVLPDGTRNPFALQRLKDKLGNRSNASAEVEFDGTLAWRLGDEGRGVRTILTMVSATRLDCSLGSAAILRQAVAQAVHHASHRRVLGRTLVDQPLMTTVLADLALESEAATTAAMRLAAAYGSGDPAEQALARIAVAVCKYWITKRTPGVTAEALECLGGNGYVEESILPRLYREAPVNAIWEGSGNVQALDVLRVLGREPQALDAFLTEVGAARGADHRFDAAVRALLVDLSSLEGVEGRARRIVERMALLFQGSLLLRFAPPAVADGFCAGRLGSEASLGFGSLPTGVDVKAVVRRAAPAL